jgi:carbonic anhydrase
MDRALADLFANNRAWAAQTEAREPGFFARLREQQFPQYLWIGCSDSRVPANQIVGLPPGDVFVHRNVANVVVHSDLNALSVMQYAIDMLHVKHIIVVGHYGCGGVTAALRQQRIGLADNWLRHVQDVHAAHRAWLDALGDDARRLDALCELNVLEQAASVCKTTVVQDAWARRQALAVHGWVYGLHNGLLQDLGITVDAAADAARVYAEALAALKGRYVAG